MAAQTNVNSRGNGSLPDGKAPSLKLVPANEDQARQCWMINRDEWKGPLTDEAYLRREKHSASQPLTENGGTTYWILVDDDDKSSDPTILAACESYRKKALVARKDKPGTIEETVSHGIGSVYCRDAFRGKGYAGRMMEELAKSLTTWQQPPGKKALFNVLYSDIGKHFYARMGWMPFPSSHITLPALDSAPQESLPQTKPLYSKDLPALCDADVAHMKSTMSHFDELDPKVRVAFAPEYDLIQWQHSREEFVAREMWQRNPEVKGVLVGSEPGKRVWCIWNRVFDKNVADSTLHIIRVAVEASQEFDHVAHEGATNGANGTRAAENVVDAIAACLRAAQLEASRWQIQNIQIWNPAAASLEAARKIYPSVKLIDREDESITSVLWYGSEVSPKELEWVGNEKYGWC